MSLAKQRDHSINTGEKLKIFSHIIRLDFYLIKFTAFFDRASLKSTFNDKLQSNWRFSEAELARVSSIETPAFFLLAFLRVKIF